MRSSEQNVLRVCLGAILCLMLSGCFFLPGEFVSQIDIRRDGTFHFEYVGEIVTTLPDEVGRKDWKPAMAYCQTADSGERRTCTRDEMDEQQEQFISRERAREQQAADIAELVGYDAYDAVSNTEFARKMTNIRGWDKVTYKGHGVYAVEYRISGTLERELTFPTLPQAQLVMPFLTIRRAKDQVVEIAAPGFSPYRLRQALMTTLQGVNGTSDRGDFPAFDRARGRLTLTSDTDLTASNGDETISAGVHTVVWNIDGSTRVAPQAQVVLDNN